MTTNTIFSTHEIENADIYYQTNTCMDERRADAVNLVYNIMCSMLAVSVGQCNFITLHRKFIAFASH